MVEGFKSYGIQILSLIRILRKKKLKEYGFKFFNIMKIYRKSKDVIVELRSNIKNLRVCDKRKFIYKNQGKYSI